MNKIEIIYGCADNGPQKKALEVLTELLLDYTLEYPICSKYRDDLPESGRLKIYIGTRANNRVFDSLAKAPLTRREEYRISVKDNTVFIEGFDDAGVLYGCMDFYNKYLIYREYRDCSDIYRFDPFDSPLPDFEYQSAPSVENRGIWTWGHVIYDYKGFIDNMVKLKMNLIIVWNDCVPVNAKEFVDYAHSCAIKVVFGFAWCWDTNCATFDPSTVKSFSPEILRTFEEQYGDVGADGIYFQSFTELNTDKINGTSIASAVTDFVNHTASLFFEKYPNLNLQFGLHATSVKNQLADIKLVDPRIKIVWENCGSFPFSYIPKDVKNFDATVEFSKQIALLRGQDDNFGVVTKGLTKLDWPSFEHINGSVCIGSSLRSTKENRIVRKHKVWKYLQAYWMTNADKAHDLVKALALVKDGKFDVTALVEDGMFEENIMFPVALFSEMLWDCRTDTDKLINEVGLRSYVDFA